MALTPFRWVALAAIGCMFMITTLVSLLETPPFTGQPSRYVLDTVEDQLRVTAGYKMREAQNLAGRYRLLRVLDSVRRRAARLPDTGAMRVFISGDFAPADRLLMDKAIRDAREAKPGNAVGVDLFIISDSARIIRGVERTVFRAEVRYEMPEHPGERCRVYVRMGSSRSPVLRYYFRTESASQQLIGPCAFYSAFGYPGARVSEWILNGGWQNAVEGSWTVAPIIPDDVEDTRIYKGPSRALSQLRVESSGPSCITGDLDACERAAGAFAPDRFSRGLAARLAARVAGTTSGMTLGATRYYSSAIGDQSGELLSDAVRALGRERFKAFWTSPDSVPVAFRNATGERWGAFVRDWMIGRYGALETGPRASGFALAMSLILVAAAIGATMLISVRRTYV